MGLLFGWAYLVTIGGTKNQLSMALYRLISHANDQLTMALCPTVHLLKLDTYLIDNYSANMYLRGRLQKVQSVYYEYLSSYLGIQKCPIK